MNERPPENWIVPCNISHFDLISHFKENRTVVWKNYFSIKKGDNAFIYIASPICEIRYKCRVIEDKVDEKILKENEYAVPAKPSRNYFSKKEKYIVLQLDEEYPAGLLTWELLHENGLGQVQLQARTSRYLQRYIDQQISRYKSR